MARKHWIGFNLVKGIGPKKVQALRDHFGNLERAWSADAADLRQTGLDRRALTSLLTTRANLDLDAELEKLARQDIQALGHRRMR